LIAWQADTMALANRADLRNNPAAMQQASMALVYKHMGAFLAQSPSFNLQRLSCTCPGQYSGQLLHRLRWQRRQGCRHHPALAGRTGSAAQH
jgi:hypothetical protein